MAKDPDTEHDDWGEAAEEAEVVGESAGAGSGEGAGAKGPLDRLADEARSRAARAAVGAAAEAAVATAGKVATGMLDGLETLLFGRVGGAEEAVKADDPDPLARIRARYDADVAAVKRAEGAKAGAPAGSGAAEAPATPPPRPAKEDPVARARAELEALKAARDKKKAGGEPIKKTL